jgi:hypothetical protein
MLLARGLLHLLATPHIADLLQGAPSAIYQWAVGPTLLNHVLVGILLLPLGYTTWLAARPAQAGEQWARRVLVANAIAVLALPISLALFMRQSEYYAAPLFLCGVGIVASVAIMMGVATVALLRQKTAPQH